MHRRIYQEKQRNAVTAKASIARTKAREVAVALAQTAEDANNARVANAEPSTWEQSREVAATPIEGT